MVSKLESPVKKQSKLLEEKMPYLRALAKGNFVAFFEADLTVEDTHEECSDRGVW